jgi:hypothetical protein
MVQSTAQTWRSYFWLCVGLAAANLALLFFFYPESNFRRPEFQHDNQVSMETATDGEAIEKSDFDFVETVPRADMEYSIHTLPFIERLSLIRYDTSISFLKELVYPLTLLRHPSVLWVIYAYGCSLSPQIIMMCALFCPLQTNDTNANLISPQIFHVIPPHATTI